MPPGAGERFPGDVARRRLGAEAIVALVLGACLGAGASWVTGGSAAVGAAAPVAPGAEVAGVQLERTVGDADALAAALRPSVLRVDAEACTGSLQASAVAVVHRGRVRVVTNAHAVVGADRVTLDDGGSTTAARVGGALGGRDAVELWADVAPRGPLPATGPEPVEGSAVVVAGHPGGRYGVRDGHVVSVEPRADDGGTVPVLVLDVRAEPGLSGGAVLDGRGRVVGLVVAADPDTGQAVAYPIAGVLDAPTGPPPTC